jgi:hypothetical protein
MFAIQVSCPPPLVPLFPDNWEPYGVPYQFRCDCVGGQWSCIGEYQGSMGEACAPGPDAGVNPQADAG